MSEWSAGYMADIDYTYGYYTELNPLRARLALLQAGLHAPAMAQACELGFGQGVTVNLHAAASGVQWTGTDFNPAHASFAQDLAGVVGRGTPLQEQAFEAFCQRSDLPDFDFIGMHGIWSWVSDANRAILVDFLERKLRPGGVLYVSYNTQPGWAAMAPMRDLLAEHAQTMSAPGNRCRQPRGKRAGLCPAADGHRAGLCLAQPAYRRPLEGPARTRPPISGARVL